MAISLDALLVFSTKGRLKFFFEFQSSTFLKALMNNVKVDITCHSFILIDYTKFKYERILLLTNLKYFYANSAH